MSRLDVPDLDPYFSPEGKGGKTWTLGEADVRFEHLPIETAFRVAGNAAMILGSLVFVLFGVPVSFMLNRGGEPDGILRAEDWLWNRWVARMASVLTVAVLGTVLGWGLKRRCPWSRWALLLVGAVPPATLIVCLVLRTVLAHPGLRSVIDPAAVLLASVFVFPASLAVCWMGLSRRGRAVYARSYNDLIARTPKVTPASRQGRLIGLGLAWALFILIWALMIQFLCGLAVLGVIRSL